MAIEIRSLTIGAPVLDNSLVSVNDNINLIPGASAESVYDLYEAPSGTGEDKAAIVKTIRLVNTDTANDVEVTLYFSRPDGDGKPRRRLITPEGMLLAPNFVYADELELTLEPGDKIQGKASAANKIQYVISGVERVVL